MDGELYSVYRVYRAIDRSHTCTLPPLTRTSSPFDSQDSVLASLAPSPPRKRSNGQPSTKHHTPPSKYALTRNSHGFLFYYALYLTTPITILLPASAFTLLSLDPCWPVIRWQSHICTCRPLQQPSPPQPGILLHLYDAYTRHKHSYHHHCGPK